MAEEKKTGTFSTEAIERMREFFVKNAKAEDGVRLDCITTLNTAMRLLLDMPRHPVGSAIDKTMNSLCRSGHATKPYMIEFNDAQGNKTLGVKPPEELQESILDAMLELADCETGWNVFGLSIMDGYHSVTLTLDYNDPEAPHIYWSDQWTSKGGWVEYEADELDEEITRHTKHWWDGFEKARKPRTCTTLWRILP